MNTKIVTGLLLKTVLVKTWMLASYEGLIMLGTEQGMVWGEVEGCAD